MNEENLEKLTINYLTQEQYNHAKENGELNENELYCTPEEDISTILNGSNVIYDLTLKEDSNHVSIPCDILRDGGTYELLCVGRLVSGTHDIYLRLNNISDNIYYQSGFGYNFTGEQADGTGTLWQGYRPAKNGFYVNSGWYTSETSRSMSKYTISLLKTNDWPVMSIETNRTFVKNSFSGQAGCQTSSSFENITSIDLLPGNGGGSFATGTRFILKKI